MADEVRIQSQGPNGNGVLFDLKEKRLGFTGPNVALMLLIFIIGGVAYLRTGTIDTTLQAGQAQLLATEDRVSKRISELFGRIDQLVDDTHAQNMILTANNAKIMAGQHELRTHFDEALVRQDTLLHQQTGAIDVKMVTLKEYVEGWFTEMAKRDEVHNHNTLHPDRALPLRSPLPPDEHPPRERGR